MAAFAFPTTPYKALQEGASALCKSVTPIFQRYTASFRKADDGFGPEGKQTDNLKTQQEMFHRLLKLLCLRHEGLVPEEELASCRLQVLDCVKSPYDDEEWPEITRDKLVFLQDLLLAGCICENEYHDAKRPLILRLAQQGADIYTQDVIFQGANIQTTNFSTIKKANDSGQDIRMGDSPLQRTDHRMSNKSSPMKQMFEAMTRLKVRSAEKEVFRVPHALDFLRPKDCPVRDPPSPRPLERPVGINTIPPPHSSDAVPVKQDTEEVPGALADIFASPLKPISSGLEPPLLASPLQVQSQNKSGRRVKNMFTEFLQKVQGDNRKTPRSSTSSDDSDSDLPEENASQRTWGFDLLRPPKKLQSDDSEAHDSHMGKSNANSSEHRILLEGTNGQGPNIVKLKKKIHSDGAPTDFFIDKVLGENIKDELSRIRAEMNKTSSGQTFTNEQIDAIATRLPVDKSELKHFFPRAWCDRYGDVVLDVVRKEFKTHVGEMESLRQAAKERRTKAIRNGENDENNKQEAGARREGMLLSKKLPSCSQDSIRKCFTTPGDDNVLQQQQQQPTPRPFSSSNFSTNCLEQQQHERRGRRRARDLCREMDLEDDLQGKLGEEIQRMPTTTTVAKRKTTSTSPVGAVADPFESCSPYPPMRV